MPVRPDVSVVVIAYNDAERLPKAVGSVLAQSLGSLEIVIVDDASTDGTGGVADRLADRYPGHVRAVHLPENSGACSRPRNVGIERAAAPYVMFLDSDDVLDRHACLNLVATAEETGSDLVSGLCTRVYLDRETERRKPWYPWLYRRRAVHESVQERPNLFYDTLSTNKCYRRAFLLDNDLRFVEGLHYEDLLFTTEAYLAARRIALVPHLVYLWQVVEKAHRPSISSRRGELVNVADRLEIHRRIDAAFRARGADELKLAKDAKFVNHDLLLHLRELRARDAEYRRGFLDLTGGYLAELDPAVFERANQIPAIAAFLAMNGDQEGALAAAEYGQGRIPELRADLVERNGRVYWGARHLDDEAGRRVLDVTEIGIHDMPLSVLLLGNTVTALERRGGRVRVAGNVRNPLGRIARDAELQGTLEFYDRRRRHRTAGFPVWVTHAGDEIRWWSEFTPARRLRPIGFTDRVWDTRLRLTVDGEKVLTRPATGSVPGGPPGAAALPVRPRLTRLAGDHLNPYFTERGHLAFRLEGRGLGARLTRAAVHALVSAPAAHRARLRIADAKVTLRRAYRGLNGRRTKVAVYNRVLTRLPVRPGTAVFESQSGRRYCGNPKYIFEELRRSAAPLRILWSYDRSARGYPTRGATLVRRGSWAYYHALARAEFWVDDHGFPAGLRKRRATTYLQTWHGSPFKRMGFDQPKVQCAGEAEQRRLRSMIDRIDCFLVRSQHDVETLVRALGVRAELLPVGYPRNDPLLNGVDPAELAALRHRLGLDGDPRTVVLYAPTFRSRRNGRPATVFSMPLDPMRFARQLGDTHILLVRPHYLCKVVLPPGAAHAVRDVGHLPDVTPLLLISDALVTDYSSVMFDYALLDRPMIFYTPDAVEYAERGGSGYFDLARHAPGPIAGDEDALLTALAEVGRLAELSGPVDETYAAARREFVGRFGELDQGTAARAVVDRLLAGTLERRPGG